MSIASTQLNGKAGATTATTTGGQGFVRLPNAVAFDARLTPTARLLFGAVVHFSTGGWTCFASLERLGKLVGVRRRQARRAMQELRDHGLVEVEERAGRTSLYRPSDPAPQAGEPVAQGTPVINVPGTPPTPVINVRGPRSQKTPDLDQANKTTNNNSKEAADAVVVASPSPTDLQTSLQKAGFSARVAKQYATDTDPGLIQEALAFLAERNDKPPRNPPAFLRTVLDDPEGYGFTRNGHWQRPPPAAPAGKPPDPKEAQVEAIFALYRQRKAPCDAVEARLHALSEKEASAVKEEVYRRWPHVHRDATAVRLASLIILAEREGGARP
jgi:hypothetical protein